MINRDLDKGSIFDFIEDKETIGLIIERGQGKINMRIVCRLIG